MGKTDSPTASDTNKTAPVDAVQHAPQPMEMPSISPEPEPVMWTEPAATSEATVRRAVDDELLSLLHTLQSQQRSNPPPTSTKAASSPAAPQSFVQRQPPVRQTIQRSEASPAPQIQQVLEVGEDNESVEVDVDRLARDVYKMLQNRLRIESRCN